MNLAELVSLGCNEWTGRYSTWSNSLVRDLCVIISDHLFVEALMFEALDMVQISVPIQQTLVNIVLALRFARGHKFESPQI